MGKEAMRKGLSAVRAGEMSFGEFAERTGPEWGKIAGYIATRWRLPNWASTEDVRQELLIAAWGAVEKFDPERGADLGRYVVWNAVDKAKKRAHKWRGANLHGNPDAAAGRVEVTLDDDKRAPQANRRSERLLGGDMGSENRMAEAMVVGECKTEAERIAVTAVLACDGHVQEAAEMLYAVPAARLEFEMGDRVHARRVVREVVGAVVARMGRAA